MSELIEVICTDVPLWVLLLAVTISFFAGIVASLNVFPLPDEGKE